MINYKVGFPGGLRGKNLPANAEDVGSIPAPGRSPGEGNGDAFQHSCLGNPMDKAAWRCTVHGVAKTQKWLGTGYTKHDIKYFKALKICPGFSPVSILCHSITVCMPAHFLQFLQCTIFFSTLGLSHMLFLLSGVFPQDYTPSVLHMNFLLWPLRLPDIPII